MIQLTPEQIARMQIIEDLTKQPTGIVQFLTWYQPSEKLPQAKPNSLYESLPVLLAIDGDFTIGYYSMAHKRWYTDLGTFKLEEVHYWAAIPDPTE